jgi:hypothetical protein
LLIIPPGPSWNSKAEAAITVASALDPADSHVAGLRCTRLL